MIILEPMIIIYWCNMQACDETEKVLDTSSEIQQVVPCSLNELVSVDMQEKVSFKKYANS
jgi:uncharacterized protein (DUF302 family)